MDCNAFIYPRPALHFSLVWPTDDTINLFNVQLRSSQSDIYLYVWVCICIHSHLNRYKQLIRSNINTTSYSNHNYFDSTNAVLSTIWMRLLITRTSKQQRTGICNQNCTLCVTVVSCAFDKAVWEGDTDLKVSWRKSNQNGSAFVREFIEAVIIWITKTIQSPRRRLLSKEFASFQLNFRII